jgi:hypothetical protein
MTNFLNSTKKRRKVNFNFDSIIDVPFFDFLFTSCNLYLKFKTISFQIISKVG